LAEPWIKMRTDLSTNPKVVAIAEALNLDEDTVVGKMHRLWSWADKHAKDGRAMGSPAWLDRMMKCKGLAAVLMRAEIDWLQVDDAWLVFPRWEEHNSQSAKTRATAMRRMQKLRADENAGRTSVAPEANTSATEREQPRNASATRGDKRRREERTPAPAAQDQGGASPLPAGAGAADYRNHSGNPEPDIVWDATGTFPLPHAVAPSERPQRGQATVATGDQREPVEPSRREALPQPAVTAGDAWPSAHADIRPELLLAIQSTGATGPRPRELLARARPEDVLLIGALVREHKERVKREEGQGKTPVGPGALLNDIKRLLDGDKTTRTHADDKRRQYRKLDREKAERIARNGVRA